MRKIVITFGLLAGVIVSVLMYSTFHFISRKHEFDNGEWLGYASMILGFSAIFFAIRQYRDRYRDGRISFGKGFLIGLYITLIASAMYVICWEIYYPLFYPDFMERYSDHIVAGLKASGASAQAVSAKMAEMKDFAEKYRNPVFRIGMTFIEVFPVGLVISLLCAALLRRKAVPVTA